MTLQRSGQFTNQTLIGKNYEINGTIMFKEEAQNL